MNEWLHLKAKPLVVRREKVYNALKRLKEHNPLYRDVCISQENLERLPEEDVLPYHIERLEGNKAQEALESRYDNVGDRGPIQDEKYFESVVVADVDAHTPAKQLTAATMSHMRAKGKSFVQVSHGAVPVNEFYNIDFFPMLYPTLFPYRCGGFEDKERQCAIPLKAHVKHLFSLNDG